MSDSEDDVPRTTKKEIFKVLGLLFLAMCGGAILALISEEFPVVDMIADGIGSLLILFLIGFFVLVFISKNANTISKIFGQKGADSNFYWGKCTNCLKKVSKSATKCPHCTADLSSPFEK